MLGSLATPSILGEVAESYAGKAAGVLFALNHFGVSEGDLKKVLGVALEKGGDYADLFFEHSFNNYIGLQDGAVNRASSNIDYGVGGGIYEVYSICISFNIVPINYVLKRFI